MASASLLPRPSPSRLKPPQPSPATLARRPVRPSATYSILQRAHLGRHAFGEETHRKLDRLCLGGAETRLGLSWGQTEAQLSSPWSPPEAVRVSEGAGPCAGMSSRAGLSPTTRRWQRM